MNDYIAINAGMFFTVIPENEVPNDLRLRDTELYIRINDGSEIDGVYNLRRGRTMRDLKIICDLFSEHETFETFNYLVDTKKIIERNYKQPRKRNGR